VLGPGGKLVIADIRHTRYAGEFEACGLKITERRSLGVRFFEKTAAQNAALFVSGIVGRLEAK
jgi:hypothetical protein